MMQCNEWMGRGTYNFINTNPALGVHHQIVHLLFLIHLALGNGPLQHKHKSLGNADIAVLDNAVAASLGILALDTHASASAMAGLMLDESAGGENTAELVVDGRERDSDSSRHFFVLGSR